jgi:hypothetical protein
MIITFRVQLDASPTLRSFLEGLMSQITDKVTELNASLDAATARITADIATLQAKIDAGGASAEDIAALDALNARIKAIDPIPDSPPVDPNAPPA